MFTNDTKYFKSELRWLIDPELYLKSETLIVRVMFFLQMDRNTWMYKIKRNTIEYLRRIDEFLESASEDMRNRGAQTLVCPCEDCQNLRRFGNIKQVRDHLIRRGFMDRYT
jgi:Transposase-associated domain